MNKDPFRTVIPISKSATPISLGDGILALGSCFAEAIGKKLTQYRFSALVNPFGPLYNPLSLVSALERISGGELYGKEDLFEHNKQYHSFDYYSSFSRPSVEETLKCINESLQDAHAQLKSARFLLITFGTAWVYRLKEKGTIVANCHKLPGRLFARELLTVREFVEAYTPFLSRLLSSKNPPTVVATVSPVRHLRDNPHENQVSKSVLFTALHEIESQFDHIKYFPAYEIMMDELRDYRFYAEDMVHPSRVAVDYIFQRFSEAFLSDRSRQFVEKYEEIRRARMHTVSSPGSQTAQQFGVVTGRKLKKIQDEYPELSLSEDEDYFRSL